MNFIGAIPLKTQKKTFFPIPRGKNKQRFTDMLSAAGLRDIMAANPGMLKAMLTY